MFNRLKKGGYALALVAVALLNIAPTQSARNGSGTYTVPNTFVSGQPITASSHNANWTDIATEITNSIAADGQTTITGALKGANGTVSLPSYSFSADLDSGMYRIGANNIGLGVNGAKVLDIGTTGLGVTGAGSFTTTLASTGNFAVNTDKFTVAATTGNTVVAGTLGVTGDVAVATNKFNVTAASGNTAVAGTLAVTGAATFTSSVTAASIAGSMVATQAQMETGTATTVAVTPGRVQNHPGVAKAWAYVTFSGGTPTLQASHNVSGITDNGAGDITVTYTTACSSALYAAIAQVAGLDSSAAAGPQANVKTLATGSARVQVLQATNSTNTTSISADLNFMLTVFCDQ
jgi:hypothetical protein